MDLRSMVSGIIFDMDGLLVDTEPVYHASWQQTAHELGHHIDDALYARFVGRPTQACEDMLVDKFGPAFPLDTFRERWPVLWRHHVDHVGVARKPGVLEILDYLGTRRLPVAVATSTDAAFADLTLERAGLRNRFRLVVTGDQVTRGKPAPDIYEETARRMQLPPAQCVALEDSEAGIVAVERAGMVGLLVPHWPATLEARRAATRVAATLYEARGILAELIEVQQRA